MADDPTELAALEPEQRSSALQHPLPPRRLGPWTSFLLALLRVYVVLAVALVVYAFVRALRG